MVLLLGGLCKGCEGLQLSSDLVFFILLLDSLATIEANNLIEAGGLSWNDNGFNLRKEEVITLEVG